MASVALLSMPAAMLLTHRTTSIALTSTVTSLPGLPRVLSTPLLALRPRLGQCQQFEAFQVDVLLLPRFVGFDFHNNLLRLVG